MICGTDGMLVARPCSLASRSGSRGIASRLARRDGFPQARAADASVGTRAFRRADFRVAERTRTRRLLPAAAAAASSAPFRPEGKRRAETSGDRSPATHCAHHTNGGRGHGGHSSDPERLPHLREGEARQVRAIVPRLVQRDNADSDELRARNASQSSSAGSTAARDCSRAKTIARSAARLTRSAGFPLSRIVSGLDPRRSEAIASWSMIRRGCPEAVRALRLSTP